MLECNAWDIPQSTSKCDGCPIVFFLSSNLPLQERDVLYGQMIHGSHAPIAHPLQLQQNDHSLTLALRCLK